MHDEKRYRDLQGALSRYAVATRKAAVNYAAAQALVNEGHDLAKDAANAIGELLRDLELAHKGEARSLVYEPPPSATALKEVLRLMGAIREASNICNISISIAQGTHEKSLSAALDAGNEVSAHLITSAIESAERLELYAFRARVLAILGLLDDLTEGLPK